MTKVLGTLLLASVANAAIFSLKTNYDFSVPDCKGNWWMMEYDSPECHMYNEPGAKDSNMRAYHTLTMAQGDDHIGYNFYSNPECTGLVTGNSVKAHACEDGWLGGMGGYYTVTDNTDLPANSVAQWTYANAECTGEPLSVYALKKAPTCTSTGNGEWWYLADCASKMVANCDSSCQECGFEYAATAEAMSTNCVDGVRYTCGV